jgi:hypothetical protein
MADCSDRGMAWRRVVTAIVTAGVIGALAVGCGDSGSDGRSSADGSSTTSTSAASSTTERPAAAACNSAALLPPIQAALDRPADPAGGTAALHVVSVDVLGCRNGYALVSAHAGAALDAVLVYLRDVDGEWEYIEAGTGIGCEDLTALSQAVQDACAALDRAATG